MFALDRPATDYLDQVPENKVPAGRALGPLKSDGTMGQGVDLMTQLHAGLKRRGVPVLTAHRATRIVMNPQGRVIGVECDAAGKTVRLRARKAVIFGSGGYAHNTEFVDAYQKQSLMGACAMPWSTGDFINIAGAAGARMGDLSTAWRSQIVLDEALQARTLAAGVFFPPGDSMLQVNRYGVRAVDENRNYNDRTTVHGYFDATQSEFPNLLMFMIYDQRSAEAFAGDYPLAGNADRRQPRAHGQHPDRIGFAPGSPARGDFRATPAASPCRPTSLPTCSRPSRASTATRCREMMKNSIVENTPTTMNGIWFSRPCAATRNGQPTRDPR